MNPKLLISIGDFNGIGPEVILKSLIEHDFTTSTPIIISPFEVIQFYSTLLEPTLDLNFCHSFKNVVDDKTNVFWDEPFDSTITPGSISFASGLTAIKAIEKCLEHINIGNAQAMVTAPISKESVNLAGYPIPGHTEFLAEKTHINEVLMMLVSNKLRVALATTHIPISEVSTTLSQELLSNKIDLLNKSLIQDFRINKPKIAVFGLNPHAGDGGVIGMDEIDIIEPAITAAHQKGIDIKGPFAADGFFGHQLYTQFDAILAMYHDQGLVPFKLLSFGKGVNFTAGLPVIRTSPDHGTAFNISGENMANESSFKEAYGLALALIHNKKNV